MLPRPIKTAPRDGSRIILYRYGWVRDTEGAAFGSPEWRDRLWNGDHVYQLFWASSGFWSERWQNWNDGVEPSGLSEPTHWTPLPEMPEAPTPKAAE